MLTAAALSLAAFAALLEPPWHLPPPSACAAARLRGALLSVAVSGACVFGGDAALAKELTPDQDLAAQAWQKTDRQFVDRTFGGQDWFKRRQDMVKKKYDGRDAVYDEIRAMLNTLNDKYTRFLTPPMYDAIFAVATGDVAGIGVELSAEGPEDARGVRAVTVSSVIDGAPSDQAGLRVGDVLVEADGTSLTGLSPEEAAAKVRGPVGSKLRLVVRRAGSDSPATSDPEVKVIQRAEVKLAAVTSSLESAGGKKIGFVRIKQFSTTTVDDVKQALSQLSDKGAQSYVLDVRGNTGGYFPGGVDVARLFLKAETPITFVVDKKQQKTSYTVFEDGAYTQPPLVLLVDERTASASEILSSALQDNGRAKLVGSSARTFGKAVIQTVEQLDDGSAVVVTMARYTTPQGTDINQRGIATDVTKVCPKEAAAAAACAVDAAK